MPLIEVVLTGDSDVRVSQRSTCGPNAMFRANLTTIFFSQSMERATPDNAMLSEPFSEPVKVPLTAVVIVACLGAGGDWRFDDKLARSLCVIALKELNQFRIDFHVSGGVFALGRKIGRGSDGNKIPLPIESPPFQLIDLVPTQAGHTCEEEYLQLF